MGIGFPDNLIFEIVVTKKQKALPALRYFVIFEWTVFIIQAHLYPLQAQA